MEAPATPPPAKFSAMAKFSSAFHRMTRTFKHKPPPKQEFEMNTPYETSGDSQEQDFSWAMMDPEFSDSFEPSMFNFVSSFNTPEPRQNHAPKASAPGSPQDSGYNTSPERNIDFEDIAEVIGEQYNAQCTSDSKESTPPTSRLETPIIPWENEELLATALFDNAVEVQAAQVPMGSTTGVNSNSQPENADLADLTTASTANDQVPSTSISGVESTLTPVITCYSVYDATAPANTGYDVQNAQAYSQVDTGSGVHAPVDTSYTFLALVDNGYGAQYTQALMDTGYGFQNVCVPLTAGYVNQFTPTEPFATAPGPSYSGYFHQPAPTSGTNILQQVVPAVQSSGSVQHHPVLGTDGVQQECQKSEQKSKSPKLGKAHSSKVLPGIDCPICDVPATGKHYGIECCDGCKAFFRRCVRAKQNFRCDRRGDCPTKKSSISRCRACRWQRCLEAGMNRKLVQRERERKSSASKNKAAAKLVDFSSLVSEGGSEPDGRQLANWVDIFHHLSVLGPRIELWARNLPEVASFSHADISRMITGHRASHLFLEIFSRSIDSPSLLMGTHHFIGAGTTSPTGNFGRHFLSTIAEPLKDLELDEIELWGIKAILFFDNGLEGIADRQMLENTRSSYLIRLEAHVEKKLRAASARRERIKALLNAFRKLSTHVNNVLKRFGPVC